MKYRLTVLPALERSSRAIQFKYETAEQMVVAKDTAARILLFIQDDLKVMADYSNTFEMEELIGGLWEEYEEFNLGDSNE